MSPFGAGLTFVESLSLGVLGIVSFATIIESGLMLEVSALIGNMPVGGFTSD